MCPEEEDLLQGAMVPVKLGCHPFLRDVWVEAPSLEVCFGFCMTCNDTCAPSLAAEPDHSPTTFYFSNTSVSKRVNSEDCEFCFRRCEILSDLNHRSKDLKALCSILFAASCADHLFTEPFDES
jgi:hypothetical protein